MVYIGTRKYKYGRLVMSHVIADSLKELFEAADKLNINKKHFQNKLYRPHFDICQTKKQIALKTGLAIEVNDKQIITILKQTYETETKQKKS